MTGVGGAASRVMQSRRLAELTIMLLAVAASITGIGNGFALDDVAIIVENERIQSLTGLGRLLMDPYWPPEAGSSLYRPLTTIAFALQWSLGNGSPLPFHVTSIVLYAAVCAAFFRLADLVAGRQAALIAGALFAVHPVHVEAVGNVVGQAELWAALFALLAIVHFIRARSAGRVGVRPALVIATLFWIALLFKEHVIVVPALLVAAELTLRGRESLERRAREVMTVVVATSIVAITFIALRTAVLGSLHGAGTSPIFEGSSFEIRFFTMLGVVTEWARLFVWPAVLSADYSPSRIELARSLEMWMIPGVIVLAATLALALVSRKRWPAVTCAIAWTAVTLLIPSNLIVVTGFVLAERALFLASAGVCLALGAGLVILMRSRRMALAATPVAIRFLIAVLISLGLVRSATRNPVWRNNETLIAQTVLDAPTSARSHMMMAQLYIDRGRPQAAAEEARVALQLGMMKNPQLFAFAADVFQMNDRCGTATRLYWTSLSLDPRQPQVRANAARCLRRLGRPQAAQSVLVGRLPFTSRSVRQHAAASLSRLGGSENTLNFPESLDALY